MAKALRKLLVFVIVFAVFAGITYIFMPEGYYQHFYFGDRIKASVTVTIDGKEVPLSDSDPSCYLNVSAYQEMTVSGRDMKLKGGEAGTYNWIVPFGDTELRFYIEHPDEKECTAFDMSFDIDTKAQTISYSGWIIHPSDGVRRKKVPVSGVYDLDYEHHSMGVYIHD